MEVSQESHALDALCGDVLDSVKKNASVKQKCRTVFGRNTRAPFTLTMPPDVEQVKKT